MPTGSWIYEKGSPSGVGSGGGNTVLGPVTGFTSQAEVGTRYTISPDPTVHLTVGFVPICPTPQPVTYLISSDNGANWVWIGSQRMQSVGQQLRVDRNAPAVTAQWKVAAVAGNLGGDPAPIPDASLNTLYAGVVRSPSFTVAGISAPAASTGITATIGSCTNVVSADGYTQSGLIPGVVYTDPTGTNAWFLRITVQILDSSRAALAPEQAYGGSPITGGTHTENALAVTYIPGLAYVRYRIYLANTNSQDSGDFSNAATNTLQMVSYNGGALANRYDVPITIPPFNPSGPGTTFNVTSVTASEVGPKYQDEKSGLHTVIGVIPVIDVDYSSPRTVTLWFDFGNGKIIWQGWYSLASVGQVVRIGDSTLSTDGTRLSGDIWVPANTAQGSWKVYCAPGRVDNGVNPTAYKTFTFTVTPMAACLANGTTAASFVNDPSSGQPVGYSKFDPGIWYWGYYELTFTPPTLAIDPNYWFTLVTVQKGATIGGVWTPAPDAEGINEDPTGHFLGRVHLQIPQLPGVSGGQTSIIQKFGTNPATWVIPPAQNKDLSANVYRDFRFWLYNVSRLGTDTSGSGGAGTYTLQTSCWPGGADHATLTPAPKTGDLDIRAANPATITLPLTGGNGQPLTIPPYNSGSGTGGIGAGYLGPQSVQAINMAQNSITAANQALAASSVVDPNIVTIGINKVTYGVSVFAGDVVLSRGIGLPVIVLQNTGIFLYGQADASSGNGGLTSKPYVGIQNNAIGLFQGGANGGSVYLDAASNAITIYSRNGSLSTPYLTVNANGIMIVNGVNSFLVNSNAMALIDQGNGNRLDMNSVGYAISHGLNGDGSVAANANRMLVMATQLQMQCSGVVRMTIDASAGTTLSDGGSNSIVLKSSGITLTTTGGGQTIMDSTGTRSISGTQCVRNAGGIGVQLWANWNEGTQTGDTTKPFIGLEASTGNVYVGATAHLLTLSGGQMSFAVTGQSPTTVITNTSISTGQAGIVPFNLTCDFFPTAGSLAGYRKETVNGTTYKVPLYNL